VKSTNYEAPDCAVFFHPLDTLSLFGPNILLNTLFSNTMPQWQVLNNRAYLKMRENEEFHSDQSEILPVKTSF
jgi:hypothetical protein